MRCDEQLERQTQYLRAVFDAIPVPAFIVDSDVQILDFNTAAAQFLGPAPASALYRRGGEAMHCLHAGAAGCGRGPLCADCILRQAVQQACRGTAAYRQVHQADLTTEKGTSSIDLLVTASLLPWTEEPRALLLLEDVTELTRLREIAQAVPISHRPPRAG